MTNSRRNESSPNSGGGTNNPAAVTATTAESILLLASPEDHNALSPSFCLLREQIEIFPAVAEDVEARRRRGGQKDPISVGRVGLRCIHCRHIPHAQRTRGAIMYPNKMALIYQATRNFQRYHLKTCPHIPPGVLSDFGSMKRKHAANNSEKYWITSAEAKGLVDAVGPPTKRGSGKRGAAKSSRSESGIEFRQDFNWTSLCSNALLVKKENPHHHTDADDPPKKTSGRKRSFYEDVDADDDNGLQLDEATHDQGREGGIGSSLPQEQALRTVPVIGDALDKFLHSLDDTYEVDPNDPSNPHQSIHADSANVDPQNTNGTSTTYSAASAVSSADFEPIPLSFVNEGASMGHSGFGTNVSTNQQQLNQYGEVQWYNHSAGGQMHTCASELPSVAASSALHRPDSPSSQQQQQQQYSLQFHQQSEGAMASNDSQSDALLAEAADNIFHGREN